jgi:Uma2 family endonuclease
MSTSMTVEVLCGMVANEFHERGPSQAEDLRVSISVRKPPPRVTLADFLEWPGDGTAKRYQLVDGEIRAMAPASNTHGLIQSTLAYFVTRHLIEIGSPCRGRTEGAVTPHVRANQNLRVPDYTVACSPDQPGLIVTPDPILSVEILSPGNESDTRENVWAYTTIPSVREILVLYSTRIGAEMLRRGAEGNWPKDSEMLGSGDTLKLESIGMHCPLTELYRGTHLAPA